MESKLNYALVGMFVALLLASLTLFVYWLGKHDGNQQYDYYHVYMTESVSGLSADASVKYLGVDVGSVIDIDINPNNSEQVQLLLQIRQGIPVKLDTKATLRFYGVTGLAFIELMGGGKESPLLGQGEAGAGGIPVIQEASSTFSNIEKTLNSLAANSADVLEKIDSLLSTDNLNNVNEILLESKSLLKELREKQPQITSLIDTGIIAGKSIDDAFKQVTVAAESVTKMAKELENSGTVMKAQFSHTLLEIDAASISIEQMADNFKQNYADVGQDVSDEVKQSLTLFRQLLYQMDVLLVELQGTTKAIEDSPSDLLFKRSRAKLGPGEEEQGE